MVLNLLSEKIIFNTTLDLSAKSIFQVGSYHHGACTTEEKCQLTRWAKKVYLKKNLDQC